MPFFKLYLLIFINCYNIQSIYSQQSDNKVKAEFFVTLDYNKIYVKSINPNINYKSFSNKFGILLQYPFSNKFGFKTGIILSNREILKKNEDYLTNYLGDDINFSNIIPVYFYYCFNNKNKFNFGLNHYLSKIEQINDLDDAFDVINYGFLESKFGYSFEIPLYNKFNVIIQPSVLYTYVNYSKFIQKYHLVTTELKLCFTIQ
ncbi:MAG: hypothetical protein A2046_09005 [Bacteroidetes bacterium GWA2_30_7]|nr:MAG: hypothetical protein A2046_09005 [Bacteroidetes bacterium GWA2_30_7]